MEKIKDFLIRNERKNAAYRLEKLIELKAPQVMIKRQRELLEDLEQNIFIIGGDKKLLEKKFKHFEIKTGRGGKSYIEFDKQIKYFPNARYGRFITE